MASIAAFVSQDRGLAWKHPVKVEFLPPAKFVSAINATGGSSGSDAADAQEAFDSLRAVGLASGTANLTQANQQLTDADVIGLYINESKAVYVRGTDLTPYVRVTLAHELTHALQDEYFNLGRLKASAADDESAVTALIEGDAVRVQNDYARGLSSTDKAALLKEQQQFAGQAGSSTAQDSIPAFLSDQLEFPYDFGPTFVDALFQKGGNAAVDAAFRSPPSLDSQIISPATFVAGAKPPSVPAPRMPAGARSFGAPSGFGQLPLLEMLGDEIGFRPAWNAVRGWTADQSVVYQQNGRTCVAVSVLDDNPSDAATLERAGHAWASHLPGASVIDQGSSTRFVSCDPGSTWRPAGLPDPYQDLAIRSVVINDLIANGHINATTSTCATDQLLTTAGPQQLEQAESTGQAPSSGLLHTIEQALTGCGYSGVPNDGAIPQG